jgi:hypothetical protein
LQGHDFCVGAARFLGVALANDLVLRVHNDATYPRVGRREAQGLMRQVKGLLHVGAGCAEIRIQHEGHGMEVMGNGKVLGVENEPTDLRIRQII